MKAKRSGKWEGRMRELCGMLGLELVRDVLFTMRNGYTTRWTLRRGRSRARWRESGQWETVAALSPEGEPDEPYLEKLFGRLSGRELVVFGTEGRKAAPFGYVVVRTERHIALPEFGSVEELKLKLAAEGEP